MPFTLWRVGETFRVSFPELLYFSETLPAGFVDGAFGMAAHAEPVAVGVLHIHFADAPRHVRRRLANDCAVAVVLLVKCVHVLDENRHPYAGLALSAFTEKNLDLAARQATKCRRIAPVPLLGKTQFVDVIVHGDGEILDVKDRDDTFEFVHGQAPALQRKFIKKPYGFGFLP